MIKKYPQKLLAKSSCKKQLQKAVAKKHVQNERATGALSPRINGLVA
jgi:hypothetical protein